MAPCVASKPERDVGAGAVRRVGAGDEAVAGTDSVRSGFSRLARRLLAGRLSRGWSKIIQGDFSAVEASAGTGVAAGAEVGGAVWARPALVASSVRHNRIRGLRIETNKLPKPRNGAAGKCSAVSASTAIS